MCTITLTATESRTTPINLKVASSVKPLISIQEAFENLASICERHTKSKDKLSVEMRGWTIKFIEDFYDKEMTPDIEEQGVLRVNTLSNKILVDSLFKEPLVSPILDREWVFNESFLERFLKQSNLSPFDGKTISPQTHKYAKEMISWVKSLPIDVNPFYVDPLESKMETESSSKALVKEREFTTIELLNFVHLGHESVATEKLRKKKKEAEQMKLMVINHRKAMQAHNQQQIEKLKGKVAETERELKEKIVEHEKIQLERVGVLQERLEDVTQKLDITNDHLDEAIETVSNQEVRIANLCRRINQLEHDVNNRPKDGGKRCVIQ